MKKLFLIFAAAVLAAGLVACSDGDSDGSNRISSVSASVPTYGGNVLVNLSQAVYDVDIPVGDESWIRVNEEETADKTLVLTVDENETGAERASVVTVMHSDGQTVLAKVKISQADFTAKAGTFVIEEVYFTGTPLPETGSPDTFQGDQYIKIRNNTDEDLYADGMMLILGSGLLSGQSLSFPNDDFRARYCAGNAFYCIPGSGRDVLVKAGESLIVVNNAQNHTAANPDSWDATKADFEWFDVSSNDNFKDVDNPDVPNLDKWYAQTLTVYSLHNRGFRAVAIAMPPSGLTAAQFLQNYPVENATYVFHSPNGSDYDQTLKNCYRVPNAWILDAVNLGCRDAFLTAPWDASLDAGYAWCGTADSDPDRFGKAVIRKTGSNGRLADTNNSANDFDSNVKASLIAR